MDRAARQRVPRTRLDSRRRLLGAAAGLRGGGPGGQREDVERIARLYWFTLEFGAAIEDGKPKAYGAGLLSSVGEMDRLGDAELRRFDCRTMADTAYDPTDVQPFYFVAPSFGAMHEAVTEFLRDFCD